MIRNDSYNSLPIKKILPFHNVIILIKSVVSTNKNKYYCNILPEKTRIKISYGLYIKNAVFW